MKLFGSIKELISAVFRKDSQEITVRPNQSTTYTAARDIQLPPGDAAHVLTSANSTQTLSNKTIAAGSNTISGLANANIDAAAAIDATKLGNGDVDNTELSKLNGLSGNISTDSNTQTLTNKTIDGDTNTVQDLPITAIKTVIGDANKVLRRDASGIPQSGNTIPNTSALVTTDATQTLSNKSLDNTTSITAKDSIFTIVDEGDITKAAQFQASGITAGQTRVMTIPDANGSIVLDAATQVLTAKDIDGGTASNTSRLTLPKAGTATLAALTRKEGTIAYDTDLDKVVVDNGAAFSALSGGSGAGELNAVLNPSVSDSLTGWTDGTSHTTTRVTSGSPLDPVITTALSISATTTASESSTSGTRYDIATMPASLLNKKLKVEVYFTTEASQTWAVSVYVGSTRLALSTDASGASLLPAGTTGKFVGYFDTTSATAYSVNFTRTAGSGTAVLKATSVIVGPGIQPQGAVVTDWVSFTPTTSGMSGGTRTAKYRRVGNTMEVSLNAELCTWSGQFIFSLPSGFTADTTALPTLPSDNGILGVASAFDQSAANPWFNGHVTYASTTTVRVTSDSMGDYWGSTVPFTWANGSDNLSINFSIPIAEWAGSGTVNLAQNDVEYVSHDGSSNVYGPQGSPVPNQGFTTGDTNITVTFLMPPQVTDTIIVELLDAAAGKWFNASQMYPYFQGNNANSNNHYGIRSYWSSATTYTVAFGNQGLNVSSSTANNGNSAWSTEFSAGTRFRVVKTKAGVAAGFGLATSSQSGLYKAGEAPGSVAGTSIAAGYIGEVIGGAGSAAGVTSATDLSGAITLTTGVWLIHGLAIFNGAAGASDVSIAWKIKNTVDNTTGLGTVYSGTPAGLRNVVPLMSRVVVIAAADSDKTVRMRATSSASESVDGYIQAVRIG